MIVRKVAVGVAALALVCAAASSLFAQNGPAPATIISASASRIVPPTSAYRFPAEKYVFSVQWRFFNAGTATVQIQPSALGERVTATAESAGFPDKIFHVHNIFNGDVDPRSYCTLHISKHSEEGPRRHDMNENLNYARLKSEVDFKDLKTSETKHTEFDIPACVTDVISGFFYVASLPLTP